tara:strand:+ start:288 stop:632 length:345 start_codon:yes stop_codon:yes gene_type:complete
MAGVTRSRTTAASIIKSIQRGQTAISLAANGAVTSTTVTITAVDLDKTFVSVSFKSGWASPYYLTSYQFGFNTSLGAYLSNSTTVTIEQGGFQYIASSFGRSGGTAYWEVVEYE